MWRSDGEPPRLGEVEFRLLRELLHEHCGIYFRDGARLLLERRLTPRLEVLGLSGFAEYHRYLRVDPRRAAELEEAIDVLANNETYLYREPAQLRALQGEILPELLVSRGKERRLRILSAGCSSGEEAYTVAALVKDSRLFEGWEVDIVGCDISRRCIALARGGVYGEHAFRTPEAESIRRWFHLHAGRWHVDEAIRRMVRFERGNLLDPHAPAETSSLDVVLCRNVMIYFDLAARRRLLSALHDRLRHGGWLLVGHSESLLSITAQFEMVPLVADLVYRKPLPPAGGS
jgi:chemotaxis protein methyltransferase CheR